MNKYRRPFTDILDEVIASMDTAIQILDVVLNEDGTQTLFCCDILHAQKGFNVTINGLKYKIESISQANETITVSKDYETEDDPTILPGVVFNIYSPMFYHGTPIATNQELQGENDASKKTPMFWLWEKYIEKNHDDAIVERTIENFELYALTQSPNFQARSTNDELNVECVQPMQRMIHNFINTMRFRSDLFDTNILDYDIENFEKFGVVARNSGSQRSVMMQNLSGAALYMVPRLFYKDDCLCPPPPFGIGSMIIGQNFIVS